MRTKISGTSFSSSESDSFQKRLPVVVATTAPLNPIATLGKPVRQKTIRTKDILFPVLIASPIMTTAAASATAARSWPESPSYITWIGAVFSVLATLLVTVRVPADTVGLAVLLEIFVQSLEHSVLDILVAKAGVAVNRLGAEVLKKTRHHREVFNVREVPDGAGEAVHPVAVGRGVERVEEEHLVLPDEVTLGEPRNWVHVAVPVLRAADQDGGEGLCVRCEWEHQGSVIL